MDRISAKRYKRVLTAVVVIAAGTLLIVFITYRHLMNRTADPIFPLPIDAGISLGRVNHTATRNGIMEWKLDAESVIYDNAKHQGVFDMPAVTFFLDNKEKITLVAGKGELDTDSNNIRITDNVVMDHIQCELRTRSLYYEYNTRRLYAETPVTLSGDYFHIQADTMVFDLDKNQTIFEGHIQGAFYESI